MMRKFAFILMFVGIFFSGINLVVAEQIYQQAKVLRVLDSAIIKNDNNEESYYQQLEVETKEGKYYIINQGKDSVVNKNAVLDQGDKIIIYSADNEKTFQIVDRLRLPNYLIVFVVFLVAVFLIVGYKGMAAIASLTYSLFILFAVMIPLLLHGFNPVLTTLLSGVLIVLPSTFITHGLNRRSALVSVSILGGLVIALIINLIFTSMAHLTGGGSEEIYYLQIAGFANVDFKALFMGGVIVGVLGVLDDVAVGQIGVVEEIRGVNEKISNGELILRSLRVGKSHVLSLVNTLALAYVGASLPLFMLFVGDKVMPWWVLLNSEGVGEEIIRTLVGSSALVLTVPIATLLAVWFKEKNNPHR